MDPGTLMPAALEVSAAEVPFVESEEAVVLAVLAALLAVLVALTVDVKCEELATTDVESLDDAGLDEAAEEALTALAEEVEETAEEEDEAVAVVVAAVTTEAVAPFPRPVTVAQFEVEISGWGSGVEASPW